MLLAGLVVAVAIGYVLAVAGLYLVQRSLLYLPDRTRPELGALAALGAREVRFATSDGLDLLAWHLPPRDGRPLVVYFHGNGGHIGYRSNRLRRFAEEGVGLLLVEYRGYGGNRGAPSEDGLYRDAAAALDFATGELATPAARLALYGESLGSAVAVWAAAHYPAAALILEAPFTRLADAAGHHYPWVPVGLLLRDRFDSLARIASVKAPILIVQGEQDRVIPVRLGRALLAAANEPKEGWFPPEAGHENLAQFGVLDVLFDFLGRRVGPPRP